MQPRSVSQGEVEFYRRIGVPRRTVRHWRMTARPNRYARQLYQWFEARGVFGASEDWAGWQLADERLVSPEGDSFSPGELRAVAYLRRCGALRGLRPHGGP